MIIGLIGTGMLGKAVGKRLLECKYQLIVYNRTKEKTSELIQKGAILAESPKEVAKRADIVITCVKDAKAVKKTLFEENGIVTAGKKHIIVADMSTINPIYSKQIAQQLYQNDIIMLDIPVMGGPNVAEVGKLVMMVGGDKKIFENHKELFNSIAEKIFYTGTNGTAHAIKLALNLQIAMIALALSEGITLAKSAKIDPELFLQILNSTYFKTGMSENKAYKMIKNQFSPTFLLKNLKKDLHTINETAQMLSLKLPMTNLAEKIYQKAEDEGFGELDYTGILAYLNNATKLENSHN